MAVIVRELLFASEDVNTSADTLITVPSTNSATVLLNGRVRFTNHTGTAATIVCYGVPNGGVAHTTNICFPTTSIAANGYVDVDVPILEAGGTFQAVSGTASSITAQCMDGFYYTP